MMEIVYVINAIVQEDVDLKLIQEIVISVVNIKLEKLINIMNVMQLIYAEKDVIIVIIIV